MADAYGEDQPEPSTRRNVRCQNPGCAGPATGRGGRPALIAEIVTAPWRIQCWRCKYLNSSEDA